MRLACILGASLLVALTLLAFPRMGSHRLAPVAEVAEVVQDGPLPESAPVLTRTGDWPCWRGPSGNGTSTEPNVPTSWSETENVVWKSPVPGRGHSSPVLCGDQVFLTTADEASQVQLVLSYDRKTGRQLWAAPVHRGGFMPAHAKNSHASATPACDGQRVYVPFLNGGALHVSATDLKGNVVWQTEAGPFESEHGYGSSPVLYRSLVVVNGDNQGGGFLAALHRATGRIVWRVRRGPRAASYGTPAVGEIAGRPQLILGGAGAVSSYDPATGKLLWFCAGPSQVTANTVAFDQRRVFASGGYPEKELLCVSADGTGDVTDTRLVWRSHRGVAYVPSPLVHGGLLYVVQDSPGIVTCLRADTGEEVWKKRLRGNFTASPVLAGGHVYIPDEEGRTAVLRAGPALELVAENELAEGCLASPAVGGGCLFLHTSRHLYCIGRPSQEAAPGG